MLAQGKKLRKSFGSTEALFFEEWCNTYHMQWKIGCSGFYYKEWKGIFYPRSIPQKDWFKFYTETFNTIELNVTFYRFPVLSSLEKWHDISPAHFRFAIKAPRLITHYKKFSDCERLLNDFYSIIAKGLKEKLGAVLFQLPPKFHYTSERLETISKSLHKGFRNVIEFRDKTWWAEKVIDRLEKEKLIFCGIDHPDLPNKPVVTSDIAYYRFHGNPRLYYSAYKRDDLKNIVNSIPANKKVKEAYIFFNNTATDAAIKNSKWVKNYLKA